MTSLPDWLDSACERLRRRCDEPWDADDWMDHDHLWTTPTGELVKAVIDHNPRGVAEIQLCWLMMFAVRRALPCWELYCDTTQPQDTVESLREWLVEGRACDWSKFTVPAQPSYRGAPIEDCRWCDTGCVARAAAESARFVVERDPILAICSLSASDMAFEQSPLGSSDHYREWFIEIAIPAAYAQRELTSEEQSAFRK